MPQNVGRIDALSGRPCAPSRINTHDTETTPLYENMVLCIK